ncbi:hypothetical protein B0H19DRAFT_1270420 [Mycena capillaripes]|nr:hypothetical protein B0H19DRAFT_1270420 [Mycena capillaripes]
MRRTIWSKWNKHRRHRAAASSSRALLRQYAARQGTDKLCCGINVNLDDFLATATRDENSYRYSTCERVALTRATQGRASTPEASTSCFPSNMGSSPKLTITGFRGAQVDVPSSPELTITGHQRAAGMLSPASCVTRARNRMHRLTQAIERARGSRAPQDPLLTPDGLWLTDVRPNYVAIDEMHLCGICHSVKAHPVSYECGHSHCYVCICVWLEKIWHCPECWTTINHPPNRHWFEEPVFSAAYPGWNSTTSVSYSWQGLTFLTERGILGL